jgi:excisionase family DNA binding protein
MNRTEETTAPPRWASYAAAERLYGLSRWTLWRLLKDGRIRGARIGRAVRLDCESIQSYLERLAEDFE